MGGSGEEKMYIIKIWSQPKNWLGLTEKMVTIKELQGCLRNLGGISEQKEIVSVEGSGTNVLNVLDKDGSVIAHVGWRPFEKGLFIC